MLLLQVTDSWRRVDDLHHPGQWTKEITALIFLILYSCLLVNLLISRPGKDRRQKEQIGLGTGTGGEVSGDRGLAPRSLIGGDFFSFFTESAHFVNSVSESLCLPVCCRVSCHQMHIFFLNVYCVSQSPWEWWI